MNKKVYAIPTAEIIEMSQTDVLLSSPNGLLDDDGGGWSSFYPLNPVRSDGDKAPKW